MANTIGNLLIILQAETSAFARGLGDARKLAFDTSADIVTSLGKIGQQLNKLKFGNEAEWKKSAEIVGGVLSGVAVAAGAAAIAVTKQVAEQAKEMSKLSQSYGLPIETISQLRVASKLTGVEMDTLTTGLGRFARAAATAAEGGKVQQAAFKEIGGAIDPVTGRLRSMNDLLLAAADQFSKVKDETGKTALAAQLFGRSGWALIPFFNAGREGLRQMLELSDQLGLTWSKEDAESAELFQQRVELLELKTTALKENLVKGLLPALDQVSTAFLKIDSTGSNTARSLGGVIGDAFREVAKQVYDAYSIMRETAALLGALPRLVGPWRTQGAYGDLKAEVARIRQEQKDFNASLSGTPTPLVNLKPFGAGGQGSPAFSSLTGGKNLNPDAGLQELLGSARESYNKTIGDSLETQISNIEALKTKLEQFAAAHPDQIFLDINAWIEKLSISEGELIAKYEGAVKEAENKALDEAARRLLALPSSVPTLTGAVQQQNDLLELQKNVNEQNRERLEIYNQTRLPSEQYADTIARLNLLFQGGALDGDTYNRALEAARERITGLFDPMQKLIKQQRELNDERDAHMITDPEYRRELVKNQQQQQWAALTSAPQAGLAGVGQGIGAGLGATANQWGGLPPEAASSTTQALAGMQRSFSGFFTSVLTGTQSIGQAFAKLGAGILDSIVSSLAQMLAKWIITHTAMLLVTKLFGSSGAKDQSATAAGSNFAQAESAAFLGAANAYAYWAWNPEIAAAAAAAALGVGQSYAAESLAAGLSGIPGAQGGWERVPADQLALLHKDEQVLPASYAGGLRSLVSAFNTPGAGDGYRSFAPAGGGGGGAGSSLHQSLTFHVNGARDPRETASTIGNVVTARVRRIARGKGVRL